MRILHMDYSEEDGNKIKANYRTVVVVHCVTCITADEKARDCFWHFCHRLHHQLQMTQISLMDRVKRIVSQIVTVMKTCLCQSFQRYRSSVLQIKNIINDYRIVLANFAWPYHSALFDFQERLGWSNLTFLIWQANCTERKPVEESSESSESSNSPEVLKYCSQLF